MSSLFRLIAFSLCGALGVGLAVGLATSFDIGPKSGAEQPIVSQTVVTIESPKVADAVTVSTKEDETEKLQAPVETSKPEKATRPKKVVQKPKASKRERSLAQRSKLSLDATTVEQPVVVAPQPAFTQQAGATPAPSTNLVDRLDQMIGNVQQQHVDQGKKLEQLLQAVGDTTGLPIPNPLANVNNQPQLPAPSDVQPNAPSLQGPTPVAPPSRQPKTDIKREGEGDDSLSIHIQDSDIREVLDMLSEQGGLNILASNSVQGKVSASLNNVDIDTALAAILKSTGFMARREGRFIYVGSPVDFAAMEQSVDKLGARIYRPNYIKATDLQVLITPLLTQGVGVCSVSTPSQIGIAANNNDAGGDTFAGGEAVLVKDYEAVLCQVDQVFHEIDKRPMQVAIEAMILSVKLADKNAFGVDFALLRDQANVRLASGTPLADLGTLKFDGGLKFGFLDSSLGVFINALETIGDTNVIATPRLMCINKHKAEILIGAQLGYVNTTLTETSTAQNVQFLEIGTQLRLRPFISNDGLIRMEVHPELSTGEVRVEGGFTLPDKEVTQVTTNIMVRDGCTVIIGGLMREDLSTTTSQIPLLGSAPGIGFLFRQKTETTDRREIIVLITPHIVYEPMACAEGEKSACDFHRRQAVYADHMSPIGTRYLGRKYFRMAQDNWARGNAVAALKAVNLAINFDPINRAAIELRSDIMAGNHFGDHSGGNGMPNGGGGPGDEPYVPIDPMDPNIRSIDTAQHPLDPGVSGPTRSILKPGSMR